MMPLSVHLRKFKDAWMPELVTGLILAVISSMSFGLGYLANREASHAPIIIEKCAKSTPLKE